MQQCQAESAKEDQPFGQELRVSDAFPFDTEMQAILSLVGDGVISTDDAGQIMLFNRAAEAMFGYAVDEVLGRSVELLIPDRFRDRHFTDVIRFGASTGLEPRLMGSNREVVGRRKTGEEFAAEATISKQEVRGRRILTVVVRDISERKRVEEEREILVAELAHRMKNAMAVVNSIVSLTARSSRSVADFEDSLQARLVAISQAQDILIRGGWSEVLLRDLLKSELAPFREEGNNIAVDGPEIRIGAHAVMSLGLVVHELATNAVKYGALSRPGGHVQVEWRRSISKETCLVLEWQESGGPVPTMPSRTGFGSAMIQRSLRALHGVAEITYPQEGLRCELTFPLT